MTRYFCTYFDHRYLARGLVMFQSLKRHCPTARLWVLCLSPECHQALTQLGWDGLIPIRLEDFERDDEPLRVAKKNRSPVEYYFTCTPSLPLFVLKQNTEINLITYLDSDLLFYSDPEPVYQEMGGHSIAIIAHRFPPQHKWMEKNGIFNVGWLTFRRDEEGLACLNWWRERCNEWCYDYFEEDRFGDQKYLDRFPKLFRRLKIIEHKGANLAAWNLRNYRLYQRDGVLLVDDKPLMFFHFQGLRKIAPGVVDPCVQWYGLRVSWLMEQRLFRPYLRELGRMKHFLAPIRKKAALFGALPRGQSDRNPNAPKTKVRRGGKTIQELLAAYRGVLARRYLLSPWN